MSTFLRGKFNTNSFRSHQRTRARGGGGGGGGEQGGGGGVYGGGSSSLSPVSSGVANFAGALVVTVVVVVVVVVVLVAMVVGVIAVTFAGSSKIGYAPSKFLGSILLFHSSSESVRMLFRCFRIQNGW